MTTKQIKKLQEKATNKVLTAHRFVKQNPKHHKELNLIIGEALGMVNTMQLLGVHLNNDLQDKIEDLRTYRRWDY